ncbi:hypothetical protein CENSYa_0181 [Cenarchaeum symbiosum A]|uniref:Uncharacterized protein n=1 Tax=Cenarchaeum symbiosum (strain A) TaxID=414004 RepID=A0RU09_CENSY|nr:hypothetical protein CENSYa_0181 [Cenarchaeum symbiosum A]
MYIRDAAVIRAMAGTKQGAACPHCNSSSGHSLLKEWGYGSVKVSRYECTCGKTFQSYLSKGGSTWTIPKNTNA